MLPNQRNDTLYVTESSESESIPSVVTQISQQCCVAPLGVVVAVMRQCGEDGEGCGEILVSRHSTSSSITLHPLLLLLLHFPHPHLQSLPPAPPPPPRTPPPCQPPRLFLRHFLLLLLHLHVHPSFSSSSFIPTTSAFSASSSLPW
ncbi:hypothetical protein E2C01_069977 [Portunus trituberculatus]|uniref:Uncharacterized protein n=1 Tax=Portunus trituberculatus TaxID=210409 RepID=A0A5B7I2B7_PORTR|nr:hypothetical protein [Portunus trituberculatus]